MRSAAIIPIHIKPSVYLAVLVTAAHLFALATIFFSSLPSIVSVGLLAVVGASLARELRCHPEFDILLHNDGRIERKIGVGETALFELHPMTTHIECFVVLLFRGNVRQRSVTLLPDSLEDAASWHELLLWLRWQAKSR